MTEKDFPALYTSSDISSKDAQRKFFMALGCQLLSLIIVSGISVINYPDTAIATGQVIVLLLSLAFTIYLAGWKPQKVWYSTRALAESIKTMTWRYVMRAEPFNQLEDEAKKHFVASIRKILSANKTAGSHHVDTLGQGQFTQVMDDLRALPLRNRKQRYLTDRVGEQKTWYAKKANEYKHKSRWWFALLIALNIGAIVSALLHIQYPSSEHWPTDVFVAAAASVMGWLQTKRFDELAASYSLTAHEIGLLEASIPTDDSESRFSTFVGDAENAFSREHTQWQARRDAD